MKSIYVIGLFMASLSTIAKAGSFIALPSQNVEPGSYAVFFSEDKAAAKTAEKTLEAIESKGYMKKGYRWTRVANGMTINSADEATAREIAATPGVLAVVEAAYATPSTVQLNAPIQIDRIDQAQLPLSGSYMYSHTGAGVHAYIVDTGIRVSHQDFGGRATNDVDVHTGTASPYTGQGSDHGTGVASVLGGNISGIAKGVRIHGVVITYPAGTVTGPQILSGLDWVAEHGLHPGVVNVSYNYPYNTADPTSLNLRSAITSLVSEGFFVSVSAGNIGGNACDDALAGASGAFTVAGVTADDRHAVDPALGVASSSGPCVSAYAEFGVHAAVAAGDTLFGGMSGTSFSAPIASGIAAMVWQNFPSWAESQVVSDMISHTSGNVIIDAPAGTPNRMLRVWPGL